MRKKKCLFLIPLITISLSLSSCGSKSEISGTSESIQSIEITVPQTEPTGTIDSTSSTTELTETTPVPTPHFIDTNGLNFREVLNTIPVRVYNRLDSDTPWDEQREAANTAFNDLQISERQLEVILTDIEHREIDKEFTIEELLSAIPSDVYNPSDTETSLDDQITLVETSYNKGLLSDRQYLLALRNLEEKQLEAATSSGGEYVDLFGTNPSTTTSGDTYIPAHGNPGTPMSNEDTGYAGSLDDAPDSSHVTIN